MTFETVEEPRSTTIQFRVSPREKLTIHRRAKAAGLKPSEFIRREALGREHVEGKPVEPVEKVLPPTAAERRVEETQRAGAPTGLIEDEVAEAALTDEAAEQAFVERRTRELYAQGRTTVVAQAEARAEWRTRAA